MKFKDVAHLYIWCTLSHKWSSLEERAHIKLSKHRLYLGTDDWIPILRRLKDMTEEEHQELDKNGSEGWHTIAKGEEITIGVNVDISNIGLAVTHRQAREMHYLTRQHFDLFGLIDLGEAIDAATINPNPYA